MFQVNKPVLLLYGGEISLQNMTKYRRHENPHNPIQHVSNFLIKQVPTDIS